MGTLQYQDCVFLEHATKSLHKPFQRLVSNGVKTAEKQLYRGTMILMQWDIKSVSEINRINCIKTTWCMEKMNWLSEV